MANMDNGTMVEAFKFLNYYQLAKNSLVSKRFRNVIETHRHKLAILCVEYIGMGRFYDVEPAVIKLFNKEISSEEYNEWVVRNNYSTQILPNVICQAAVDRRVYKLTAYGDYKDPNLESAQVLHARVKELNNETWPLFQHFVRLITDPFICIRNLELIPHAYVFKFLASTIDLKKSVFFARVKELNHETWPLFQHFVRLITDPFIRIRNLALIPQPDVLKLLAAIIEHNNRGRLQCETLDFDFEGDVQETFSWVKDHVRCARCQITDFRSSLDHDKQLLDFFATGSHCTSDTFVIFYEISKDVMADVVQKFADLKSRDDIQLVESIRGRVSNTTAEALKSNYATFFIEEEKDRYGLTARVFEFVNADIGKKMRLAVSEPHSCAVTLMIINL